MGHTNDAETRFCRALEIAPEYHAARWNRGLIQLLAGDFDGGWTDYEFGLRSGDRPILRPGVPIWRGEPLEGRTLLVVSDQGYGDLIQFVRLLPALDPFSGRVFLACPSEIRDLMETAKGAAVVMDGTDGIPAQPADSAYEPAGDPCLTLGTIPRWMPSLRASESERARWQATLRGLPGLLIGIAWTGNAGNRANRRRSCPPELFRTLAELPDVSLVSLQKGITEDEARAAEPLSTRDLRSPASRRPPPRSRLWTWLSRSRRRWRTWPARWANPYGPSFPSRRTGAGCWTARTIPGIPRCASSGRSGRVIGSSVRRDRRRVTTPPVGTLLPRSVRFVGRDSLRPQGPGQECPDCI